VDFEEIERITELIYESANHEDGWQQVTTTLSELFGNAAIVIDHQATSGGDYPILATTLFDENLRNLHFEEYRSAEDNPGVAALLRARVGVPFALRSILEPTAYDRDPATRALLRPQRIDKGFLVALDRQDGRLSYMNVFRRRCQSEFSEAHERAVSFFAKHIARSLQLSHSFILKNRRRAAVHSRAQAKRTTQGVMLLDRRCRVIDADVSAVAILETRLGLALKAAYLVSTSTVAGQDTPSLHRFVSSGFKPRGPFVICGGDGDVVVIDWVQLLDGPRRALDDDCFCIIVRLLRLRQSCDVTPLGAAYGLTNGELRVLDALASEPTVASAANALGLSRDTIKTHLKQIYSKTQCRSLAELMRLIGRFQ
jgi:DNA-binding CsgD family transcriptional regulator